MFRGKIVFFIIIFLSSFFSVSQQRTVDVKYSSLWNNMSENDKHNFIVGFFAGIRFAEELASSIPSDISISKFSFFLDTTFNCTEEEMKSLMAYMNAFYMNPANSSKNLLNAFSWSWGQLRP